MKLSDFNSHRFVRASIENGKIFLVDEDDKLLEIYPPEDVYVRQVQLEKRWLEITKKLREFPSDDMKKCMECLDSEEISYFFSKIGGQ